MQPPSDKPLTHRDSRGAQARRVCDSLRMDLQAHLDVGDVLPAEAVIAATHRVSRNAARQALSMLREEGLVTRKPGAGTLVVSRKTPSAIGSLQAMSEYIKGGAGRIVNEVLAAREERASPSVARRLERPDGEKVVLIERRRLVDGEPLSLETTYVTGAAGRGLLHADLAGTDLFLLMERQLGIELMSADTAIEALPADDDAAHMLEVAVGAPLLVSGRVVRDCEARAVICEVVRYRHDRIVLAGATTREREPRS